MRFFTREWIAVPLDNENRYVHRLLFDPEDEVEILFKDLKVIRTARRDRRLPYLKDRFRELDWIPAPGKK